MIDVLVEDMNIPGSYVNGGDICMNDFVAVDSCVPEGSARLCGNETGLMCNYYYIYIFGFQIIIIIYFLDHYNFQPGATAIRFWFHSDSTGTSGRGFRLRYKMAKDCSSYFHDIIPSGFFL